MKRKDGRTFKGLWEEVERLKESKQTRKRKKDNKFK
jgi:hypothetical protein